MEELQAIRLGHLTQDGSFSFLNFTKKKLTLLPQDSSEPELPDVQSVLRTLALKSPRLQKAVDKFVEAVEAFDAALRMARKKPLTEQLSAADEDRDKAWMGSNTYINAMLNHPDAEVAAVAKIAREIFDKYGNPTRLSRKEESSSLHNLLQDIEAMESRSTIDFDPWYNWMKTTYEAFEALRSERARKPPPLSSRAKLAEATKAPRRRTKNLPTTTSPRPTIRTTLPPKTRIRRRRSSRVTTKSRMIGRWCNNPGTILRRG